VESGPRDRQDPAPQSEDHHLGQDQDRGASRQSVRYSEGGRDPQGMDGRRGADSFPSRLAENFAGVVGQVAFLRQGRTPEGGLGSQTGPGDPGREGEMGGQGSPGRGHAGLPGSLLQVRGRFVHAWGPSPVVLRVPCRERKILPRQALFPPRDAREGREVHGLAGARGFPFLHRGRAGRGQDREASPAAGRSGGGSQASRLLDVPDSRSSGRDPPLRPFGGSDRKEMAPPEARGGLAAEVPEGSPEGTEVLDDRGQGKGSRGQGKAGGVLRVGSQEVLPGREVAKRRIQAHRPALAGSGHHQVGPSAWTTIPG